MFVSCPKIIRVPALQEDLHKAHRVQYTRTITMAKHEKLICLLLSLPVLQRLNLDDQIVYPHSITKDTMLTPGDDTAHDLPNAFALPT